MMHKTSPHFSALCNITGNSTSPSPELEVLYVMHRSKATVMTIIVTTY